MRCGVRLRAPAARRSRACRATGRTPVLRLPCSFLSIEDFSPRAAQSGALPARAHSSPSRVASLTTFDCRQSHRHTRADHIHTALDPVATRWSTARPLMPINLHSVTVFSQSTNREEQGSLWCTEDAAVSVHRRAPASSMANCATCSAVLSGSSSCGVCPQPATSLTPTHCCKSFSNW